MSSTLVLYRTAPKAERKAAKELRENRARAYVPRDLSAGKRHPTARGYVFSDRAVSRVWTKHVGPAIGTVSREEIKRLWLGRARRRADEANPYSIGQKVWKGEVPARVLDVRGRSCIIATEMLGKQHTQAIHYTQLRPG